MTHAPRKLFALIASLLCLWSIGAAGDEKKDAKKDPLDEYHALADKAFKAGKPIVVFVGASRDDLQKALDDCLMVKVDSFPGATKTAIVVGVPSKTWFTRYDMPANASAAQLRKILPPRRNPATVNINRDNARHKQFLDVAKKGDIDVVFLGDSITQGWEKNGKEAWKKFEAFTKPANFGIGGDQTGHVLWRLTEGKEFDDIKPKAVVLMIGTNNTAKNSAEDIAGGITEIVKTIQKKTPKTKILLLAVFPRDAQPDSERRVKINAINKIIARLDDGGKRVKYLDIGSKFLQKDGVLTKEVMPDLLHLSPMGYDIWAEAITPTLKSLLK